MTTEHTKGPMKEWKSEIMAEPWSEHRPTPRTDKQAVNIVGFYSCATVPADFARQLETECETLRTLNKELVGALYEIHRLAVPNHAEWFAASICNLCEEALSKAKGGKSD